MTTETETQAGMKQTIIWIGVMIAAVIVLAYFAS